MKRKLIFLVLLSFVFIFAGSALENCYPTEVSASSVSVTKLSFSWGTPKPKKSSTPAPSSTPTLPPVITASPTAEPSPTPSPTPDRPYLPGVAVPHLDYPATEAPASTPSLEEFEDEPTPTPSPSPTVAPTENPADDKKPTWSGLVKFITIVFYVAAVFTALYALFFFIICALFGKEPVSGFAIFKKKKKKKKKKKAPMNREAATTAEQTTEPKIANGFGNEADSYFSGEAEPVTEEAPAVVFQRRDDQNYRPVISVEGDDEDSEATETTKAVTESEPEIEFSSDFTIDDIPEPESQPETEVTAEFAINEPVDETIDLQATAEFLTSNTEDEFVQEEVSEEIPEEISGVIQEAEAPENSEIFTEDDLPEVDLDSQPEIEETVSSYFSDDLDLFEKNLPEPPKESKSLTFRRAADIDEEKGED